MGWRGDSNQTPRNRHNLEGVRCEFDSLMSRLYCFVPAQLFSQSIRFFEKFDYCCHDCLLRLFRSCNLLWRGKQTEKERENLAS
jgi:hypothetical protein